MLAGFEGTDTNRSEARIHDIGKGPGGALCVTIENIRDTSFFSKITPQEPSDARLKKLREQA